MTHFLRAGLLVCMATTPLVAQVPQGLKPKDAEAMEIAAAAYVQGNPLAALAALSPLAAKLDAAGLAVVDEAFAGRNLPAVGKLLAEARLALVRQGRGGELPKLHAREAVLVLPQFEASLAETLAQCAGQRVFASPLPSAESIEAYESLLWDCHVLENRLDGAIRIAQYAQQAAKGVPRQEIAQFVAGEARSLLIDFAGLLSKLQARRQELDERETELRIFRLGLAREVLSNPQISKERILAAYAWQVDSVLVDEFFVQNKARRGQFARPDLNEPDVPRMASADAQQCRRLAGDLTQKSQALFMGLHWWLRGRYGLGPEVYGLAKPAAALKSPEMLFALYMPEEPPKPTNPIVDTSAKSAAPLFDRRHHYWWAWEDRSVARSGFEESNTTKHESFEGKEYKKFFW